MQSERANVTDSPQNQASFISAAVIKVRRVSNYGDEEPGYNSSDDLSPVDAEDGPTFFVKSNLYSCSFTYFFENDESYLPIGDLICYFEKFFQCPYQHKIVFFIFMGSNYTMNSFQTFPKCTSSTDPCFLQTTECM